MEKEYENVCMKCSQTFITNDVEDLYCMKCWKEMLDEVLTTDTKELEESTD